jgi:hypothetical protein
MRFGILLLEVLWGRSGVRPLVLWSDAGRLRKALYLDHSPKYSGTPYTTGAAPLRYRK